MESIGTGVLGRTERTVTRVGLGGEGVLRTQGRAEDAGAVIVRLGAEALSVQIIAADGQVVAELP